jgi:hypothetical protein
MTDFASEVRDRITAAKQSLSQARAEDDDYLVAVRTGELESLSRLAADNGVEVPPVSLEPEQVDLPATGTADDAPQRPPAARAG